MFVDKQSEVVQWKPNISSVECLNLSFFSFFFVAKTFKSKSPRHSISEWQQHSSSIINNTKFAATVAAAISSRPNTFIPFINNSSNNNELIRTETTPFASRINTSRTEQRTSRIFVVAIPDDKCRFPQGNEWNQRSRSVFYCLNISNDTHVITVCFNWTFRLFIVLFSCLSQSCIIMVNDE